MLIDFSFANHKSFREPQQFSMARAFPEDDSREDQLCEGDAWEHSDVVAVSAIYGGNASGKSTFLDALTFVPRLLDRSLDLRHKDTGTGRTPFLLDKASSLETSDYLFVFIASDGNKYLYEVSLDDSIVQYESLRRYTTGNRTIKLFEREPKENGEIGVTYGRGFTGKKRALESQLRRDRLFLGIAGSSGALPIAAAFEELHSMRLYLAAGFSSELQGVARRMQAQPERARALSLLLASSGLGVRAIEADMEPREIIERCLMHPDSEEAQRYRNIFRGLSYITMPDLAEDERDADADKMAYLLFDSGYNPLLFLHVGEDGAEAYLSEEDESRGTQAALAFLSLALDKLSRPSVTLVDEIDTSLHPAYVEQLIGLFSSSRTNPHQSQLIFTTHDYSLITRSGADDRPLTRDQIWITAKGPDGSSVIFPLTSIKGVRKDENFGRNYLNGVYGGLPDPLLEESFVTALESMSKLESGERNVRR